MVHYEKFACDWYDLHCLFVWDGDCFEVFGAEHRDDGTWFAFYLDGRGDASRAEEHDYLGQLLGDNIDNGWSCGSYDSLDELIADNEEMGILRTIEF